MIIKLKDNDGWPDILNLSLVKAVRYIPPPPSASSAISVMSVDIHFVHDSHPRTYTGAAAERLIWFFNTYGVSIGIQDIDELYDRATQELVAAPPKPAEPVAPPVSPERLEEILNRLDALRGGRKS